MTKKEFDKIVSIKAEIDGLERILYGYFGTSRNPTICNLQITYLDTFERDKTISISKELSNDILKLIKEKLEKLKIEFNNFKTE